MADNQNETSGFDGAVQISCLTVNTNVHVTALQKPFCADSALGYGSGCAGGDPDLQDAGGHWTTHT